MRVLFKGWRHIIASVLFGAMTQMIWDQAVTVVRNGDVLRAMTPIRSPFMLIIVRNGGLPAWFTLCNSGETETWRLTIPAGLIANLIGGTVAYFLFALSFKKNSTPPSQQLV